MQTAFRLRFSLADKHSCIDCISVSRISHPSDRFTLGQTIQAVVTSVSDFRIGLSHKELLGTWMENAAKFAVGETVSGIVRSVESYGIFVELTPNLAGLAEPKEHILPKQRASVYIKAIIPEKMKIKLVLIDAFLFRARTASLHLELFASWSNETDSNTVRCLSKLNAVLFQKCTGQIQ